MSVDKDEAPENPDIHFEPIVTLPKVELKTLEEDEEELVKLACKMYRYDQDSAEWKERGRGDVKILKHKTTKTCRVLMRRDKTLKICANHFILPHMELKRNLNSERAWVWSTPGDFADEEEKMEVLAIRFASVENATAFKEAFDQAKDILKEADKKKIDDKTDDEKFAEKLSEMSLKDNKTDEQKKAESSTEETTSAATEQNDDSEKTSKPAEPDANTDDGTKSDVK